MRGGRGRSEKGVLTVMERAAQLPSGTNLKSVSLRPELVWLGYDRGFHDTFEIKKLLGKGAFASVYLASIREGSMGALKGSLGRVASIPAIRRALTRSRRGSSKHSLLGSDASNGGSAGSRSLERGGGVEPPRGDLAVKVIEKESLRNLQEALWLHQEAETMRVLGGSLNAVTLAKCYESRNHVYLVMELCTGGNLLQKLSSDGALEEEFAASLMTDILRMAYQCHSKGVIHRDIKPENFLFSTRLPGTPLKMTDFGLADYCSGDTQLSEISGTPYYIAPEVIRQKYGLPADIWSCGAVMYKILTGNSPFSYPADKLTKVPYKTVFRRILNDDVVFDGPPWDTLSAEARDLCSKLLQKDPKKRPTAEEALQHPWLGRDEAKSSAALEDSLVQRMQLYATYNVLKQKALFKIAREVAPDDFEHLQELWNEMNFQNSDGFNTVRMLDGLELAGYTVGEREGSNLLRSIIGKGETQLTFEQFATSVLDWKAISTSASQWEQAVAQEFVEWDIDRDGKLSLVDLLETVGGAEQALKVAIAEGDVDKDGCLNLEEFSKMMRETAAAEGFDKRLSSRYRYSFPRRTTSFLNLHPGGSRTSWSSVSTSGRAEGRRSPSRGSGEEGGEGQEEQEDNVEREEKKRLERGLSQEILDTF